MTHDRFGPDSDIACLFRGGRAWALGLHFCGQASTRNLGRAAREAGPAEFARVWRSDSLVSAAILGASVLRMVALGPLFTAGALPVFWFQLLMQDAPLGRFDLIYAEALDRISRDQEDVAAFFKRMAFAEVTIVTLAEGEISELHVGLNALFLKDLAQKTRRGLQGRVLQGLSGGGVCYGYDLVPGETGSRRINATGRHDKFFLGGVNGTVGQVHAN